MSDGNNPTAPAKTPTGDLWLVSKDGQGWIRADGMGYTNILSEAMRYSREMAYDISHPFGDNGPIPGLWMHSLQDVLDHRASLYQKSSQEQEDELRAELASAYKAGALEVHRDWLDSWVLGASEHPKRGEPDFSEAARDYAAFRVAAMKKGEPT